MTPKMTMTKRYYFISSAVNYVCEDGNCVFPFDPPLLLTLGEALESAKSKLSEKDGLTEIYIVEVIKIVRKVSAPFEVIDVRK